NTMSITKVPRNFLHRIEPGELADEYAHGVARMNETVSARHGTAVRAVRICRRPITCTVDFSWLNRTIADRRPRQEAMAECDCIHERLEGRTHLPVCRSQRPIEFALRVITAAHQRADPATCIINHHDC